MTASDQPIGSHPPRRAWIGVLLVWVAVSLPLVFLYLTSRRVVLNEIRNHAMGVAIAAAAGMDVDRLEAVRGAADVEREAYMRTQALLNRLVESNRDVRYIYTMRRSQAPFAPAYAFEYVVDQPARDFNQNGRLDEDERSEPPGQPYDASGLPALQEAWEHPSADREITPDPPYPDLISGYAPVRNAEGRTVAIVGVDVTATTFHQKMRVIQVVMVVVWFVLCVLITMVVHLYYLQAAAFEQNKKMGEELATRNEMLRKANAELATRPSGPAGELSAVRRVFESYYLSCAAVGPAMAGVLEIDQDHVGVYLADAGGSGAGEALVGSLMASAAGPPDGAGGATASSTSLYAELRKPEAFLAALHNVLSEELPPGDRVGVAYLVINLSDGATRYAAAGLPSPLRYARKGRRLDALPMSDVPALGGREVRAFAACEARLEAGDRLVFRACPGGTDGRCIPLPLDLLRREDVVRSLETESAEGVVARLKDLVCGSERVARCSWLVVDVR